MTPRCAAARVVLAVVVSSMVFAASARAQPASPTGGLSNADWEVRQRFITDAQTAARAGEHARAIELGLRAGAMLMTPSLRLFLAREQEQAQSLVDAYATAQRCVVEAERDLQLRDRPLILSGCREIQERLRNRVAYVVVKTPGALDGLSVKLSGHELNRAAIGIPYLVQPGNVVVEAAAPGYQPYRLEIEVPEGRTVNVILNMARATGPNPGTTDVCPAGQRPGADGRCTADDCRVGMSRTTDGVHCCWPGQSWDAQTTSCRGTPVCPAPLVPSGESCTTPTAGEAAADVSVGGGSAEPAGRLRFDPWVGKGLMIAGGAILLAGGTAWLLSELHYQSLEDACTRGCSRQTYDDGRRNVRRLDRLAVVGLVTGAVVGAAGVGVYNWFTARPADGLSLAIDPRDRAFVIGLRY